MLAATVALLVVSPLLAERPPTEIKLSPTDITAAPPDKQPEPERLKPVPKPVPDKAPENCPAVEEEPVGVESMPVIDPPAKKHKHFHRKHKDDKETGSAWGPEFIEGFPSCPKEEPAKHSHFWHKKSRDEHPAGGDGGFYGPIGPWGGPWDDGPNAFDAPRCVAPGGHWRPFGW
jgi:hypothetical protein